MTNTAFEDFNECALRLARAVDDRWADLLGMGEPGSETRALNAIQEFIDRYRDADSARLGAAQRLDLERPEQ